MKRFSKFQKISSLVLAFVMILSLAMPYMGTVEASDTNGWTIGSNSGSTIEGNETDGWKISLKGSGTGADNFSSYTTNIGVSKLQIVLDISTMDNGNRDFYISFGDARYGLSAWGETKAFFTFKKMSSGALEFGGHVGNATVGYTSIASFKFDSPIVFEFVKNNGKWQPAINGTIYEVDGTDAFVKGMLAKSPDTTVVGIMRNSGTAIEVKNIKFNSADWKKGANSTSTVTGDEENGWNVTLTGSGTGSSNFIFHTTNISVSKLQIVMDLSTAGNDNRDVFLSIGKNVGDLGSWDGTGNIAFFTFRRTADGKFRFAGTNGSTNYGQTTIEIDFAQPIVFEFVKDLDGKWQPAINGIIYSVDHSEQYVVDTFVNSMLTNSPEETVIGLMRNNATNSVKINNIQFKSSDWKKGANSTSTADGDEENGWKVTLTGSGTGSSNFISHTTNISVSKLQIVMDLSTAGNDNRDVFLSIGKNVGDLGSWDGTGNIAFFTFRRTTDGKFRFAGTNGSTNYGQTTIEIDFAQPIVFEFVKDSDGKWQPAINGIIYSVDHSEQYVVDTFVNSMLTNSPEETVIGLMRNNATNSVEINNIKFTEKVLENNTDGWTIGEASGGTITPGNQVEGWSLSLGGSGYGDTNFNTYSTNIGVSNLIINLNLSDMLDDANRDFVMSLGNNSYGLQTWSGEKVFFKFTRKVNSTGIKVEGFNGSDKVYCVTEIDGFDFDKTFTFEFLKDSNGNWQPAINGTIFETIQQEGNEVNTFVKTMTKNSPTNTIVGLVRSSSTAITITNINFMPKATALGATIATAFEENTVPIKMGFDYSGFKTYLNGNKYETLVNYGAVLVAKEAKDASAMQDALKAELTQGGELQGTSYSDDYTFMFRAGEKSTVPDEYHVVIKKSDNVEYMDKNIWAIGFVVTESWDGTYKYYFTENTDTSRNIENGVIEKSVTELLKVSCAEIVAMSDTDDEYKQTLDDSIKTFNDGCSVDTLKTMIETGLQESDTEEGKLQRELLKYVHLNFSNGAPTVLSVAEYGAVGDGTTDDTAAITKVLAVAQETQKKTLIIMS